MMLDQIKRFKGAEVELEYLLTGETNAETIMFVHGAGANLRQFIPQHHHFSERFKVLSVSLRGHGLSTSPTVQAPCNYTIERLGDDVLELLGHLQLTRIHYVGNSAGGVVGFYIVGTRPELIESLTTFGTTGEMKFSSTLTSLIAGIDKLMLRLNPGGYMRFMSKATSKQPEVQAAVYEQFMMAIHAIPHFRRNLGHYSFLEVIKQLNVPYLLIQGEYDNDINRSLKSTLEAMALSRQARVIGLKGAGHIANLDKPQDFNGLLEEILT